jgi:hypothetical protein
MQASSGDEADKVSYLVLFVKLLLSHAEIGANPVCNRPSRGAVALKRELIERGSELAISDSIQKTIWLVKCFAILHGAGWSAVSEGRCERADHVAVASKALQSETR